MAAPARAPGPGDARVPCPLCGGLIHPIAGRCKHCKADINATRSARPAAAAALPALIADAPVALPASAHVVTPIAPEGSRPILPPRPTGRIGVPANASPASAAGWSKRWPTIVIAVATLAIIIAVIALVWPKTGTRRPDAKTLAPPPAPERMNTSPLPSPDNGPRSGVDPWPGGPPPTAPAPPAPPAIDDIPDPPSLRDPLSGGGLGGPSSLVLLETLMTRACAKLTSCPDLDDAAKQMCDVAKLTFGRGGGTPPTCAAAQRCVASFERAVTCDKGDDMTTIMSLMSTLPDCAEALRC
jgi:hypothetical protein